MWDSSQTHAHRNQAQQGPVSEMLETPCLRGGNAADGWKVFISPGLRWDSGGLLRHWGCQQCAGCLELEL